MSLKLGTALALKFIPFLPPPPSPPPPLLSPPSPPSVSSSPSRIINVSSVGHWLGSDNFADLSYEASRYDPTLSYSQSKLANVLFTAELNRRLRGSFPPIANADSADSAKLTRVTVNALHPGVVDTQLFRHVWLIANPVSEYILRPIRYE